MIQYLTRILCAHCCKIGTAYMAIMQHSIIPLLISAWLLPPTRLP